MIATRRLSTTHRQPLGYNTGMIQCFIGVLLTFFTGATWAGEILIHLPQPATHATVLAKTLGLKEWGKIEDKTVKFVNLLPDNPYDIMIELADGTALQGVDMGWYGPEPADPDAGALDDDDKSEIDAIVTQVPSFYDSCRPLIVIGTHQRAVVLAELLRERDFHAAGGNVIWRVELWYFENQNGGWAKVQQQNQVLRRERFASEKAFHAAVDPLRWVPQLGAVRVGEGKSVEIKVTVEAIAAAKVR